MRVLITGCTGFIGGRVARTAMAQAGFREVVLLTRRGLPGHAPAPGPLPVPSVRYAAGDLGRPVTLRGLCEGVDTVLHCATRVGGDEAGCWAVNAAGTRALVDEARRAGVSRFVQLGTAAVYGRGPFRGARPADLTPAPVSATSRSRLAGELAVLAAGGTVLRPHLVHGPGDRWVLPALLALERSLGGSVGRWSASASVIAVDDLARALVATALAAPGSLASPVYHANHPRPVTIRTLLWHRAAGRGPGPRVDLSLGAARQRLRSLGRSAHDLDIAAVDHWFDSEDLWRDLDLDPGPGLSAGPDQAA